MSREKCHSRNGTYVCERAAGHAGEHSHTVNAYDQAVYRARGEKVIVETKRLKWSLTGGDSRWVRVTRPTTRAPR